MKRTVVMIIATGIFTSGSALADSIFPECQILSPADAAVLSVAQLKVRYCEAKAKNDQGTAESLAAINAISKAWDDTMPGRGGTRQQLDSAHQRAESIQGRYAGCSTAMGSIAKLSAEKGRKIEIDSRLIDEKMCS